MIRATLLLVLLLGGCTRTGEPQSLSGTSRTKAGPDLDARNTSTDGEAEPAVASSQAGNRGAQTPPSPPSAPPHRLPERVLPGVPTEIQVPGDRPVRVVHAGPTIPRPLVYLHGMCGNPEAMADWSPLATHYGTLVVLRADVPCGDRPGFKWPQQIEHIQSRIDRALKAVAEQRGAAFDTSTPALIGYSQGAHRAERLAAAFPERYTHLILGGPPGAPEPARLGHVQGVAILGGERENTTHMVAADAALNAAGIRSRFFLLPKVGHGAYGPDAVRVFEDVFSWLFDESPRP